MAGEPFDASFIAGLKDQEREYYLRRIFEKFPERKSDSRLIYGDPKLEFMRLVNQGEISFGSDIVPTSEEMGEALNYYATESVAKAFGWNIITDPKFNGNAPFNPATDASTAIVKALNSPGKTAYIPLGDYTLDSTLNLTPYSGKRLTGAGSATLLKFKNDVTGPGIMGTSAGVSDLQIDNLSIDMQGTATSISKVGIQITSGKRITIDSVSVLNATSAAILLQGLGAGTGTVDSSVTNCLIDGAGLDDKSTGFGIWLKDASINNVVTGNRLRNIKGGMGIGLGGSANTGYPRHNIISHNHIRMVVSTIGFEAIGLTTGCNHNVVSNNVIPESFDNGISITGNYNAVIGNVIGTAWNHGIGVGGSGNTVTGNNIRNIGRQDNLEYGGVSLEGAYNTVSNNFIFDDREDNSPYQMAYKVKFVGSKGNNVVGPNNGYGFKVSEYTPINKGRVTSDIVISTGDLGYQLEGLAIRGAVGSSRVLRFKTDNDSRWAVVVDAIEESGDNAGSDLNINAYDDSGVSLGTALKIKRSNKTVKSTSGFIQRTKAGAPVDADFASPPEDGTTVLDTTNHRLYIRSGGGWKYTSLAALGA